MSTESIRLPDDQQREFFAEYLDAFLVDRAQLASLASRSYKVRSADEFVQSAGSGDLELFQKVVEANKMYDPKKAVSEDGFNCVTFAVHNQCLDILEYLIKLGCSINGNGQDRSPLMDAVQYGYEPVVKLLLDKGANVKDTDAEGWTALGLAVNGIMHDDKDKAKRIVAMLKARNAPMSDN